MTAILVNGDSFSSEKHFAKSRFDTSYIKETWAYSIGAKNISLSGCSNDKIFDTTIEYLNENTVDILIIGWTEWSRSYTTLSNGLTLNIRSNNNFDDLLFGDINIENNKKVWSQINTLYYKECFNFFLNFKKFLNYYLHLQDYCELKKIRFLNFLSFRELPNLKEIAKTAYINKNRETEEINHNIEVLSNLLKKFKAENWVNKKVGFCYYKMFIDKKFKTLSKEDGHPGLEASQYWGKLIKENL
jgi:hypothetical protein